MRFLASLCLIATAAVAAPTSGRTSPPAGALTVGGSSGKYSTIQDAVNALSTSSSAQVIFIYPGTYSEQVTIPSLNGPLTIYGSTSDTSSYSSNTVSIEHSAALNHGYSHDKDTGTLINNAANTKVYNINIKNTYGKGAQAIALAAYGSQQGYYGVGLYGYQDTLLANQGTQVYGKCYIAGAVDWIFGQLGQVWIDGSSIVATASGGAVTASGRSSASSNSWYVINRSTISSSSGVDAGSVYLGRPWADYARVVVQNSNLGSAINSAGWEVWQKTDQRTDDVVFEEYGNTGAGASGTRANFTSKLSSAVSIGTVLGSGYSSWVDSSYLS